MKTCQTLKFYKFTHTPLGSWCGLGLWSILAFLVCAPLASAELPTAKESDTLLHLPTPEFAPDLTFKDDKGKTYNLDDYLGKAVLLHFWATWCPTCREEMVALDRLKAAFSDKPLAVLSISVDESDDEVAQLRAFFKDKNITYLDIFLEPSLNSEIIPTTYVIDKKGNIFAALSGPTDWSTAQNINIIRKALGEQ